MFKRVWIKIRMFFSCFKKVTFGSFGRQSLIDKPLLIAGRKHIFVGNKVYIRKGARIEMVVKWNNQAFNPRLIIEDGVTIEQSLHLSCANSIIIEKNVEINSFVFITDIDHDYSDTFVPIKDQKLLVKEATIIGENSFIGTGVKIMAGCKIGKHCIIGANAVVTHDIPDFSVAVGIPATVIKQYNFDLKQWIETKKG